MDSSKLILYSPLEGWSAPLEETPDPVFAGRMMGDGVAIDPTGSTLHAPCEGIVTLVPATRHAVTLRADNGAEILLHIGIDTVALAGEGFELHVREGQRVGAGDRLISFDLEVLAKRARSLVTPVIVTDGSVYAVSGQRQGCRVKVGDALMEIAPKVAAPGGASAGTPPAHGLLPRVAEAGVLVVLEHGIHARPAASIAAAVKSLSADVNVILGQRSANAKSPVALMSLGVRKGDRVVLRASGADAPAAIAVVERALAAPREQGDKSLREQGDKAPIRHQQGDTVPMPHEQGHNALKGVIASRGMAVGRAWQFARATMDVAENGAGAAREHAEFDRAREAVRVDLARSIRVSSSATREIAEAHLGLVDDPDLTAGAHRLIESGKSAGYAWRAVLRDAIATLRSLKDPRMAERADDLLDLESRVLVELGGQRGTAPEPIVASAGQQLPPQSILIANELLPSQLMSLDATRLAGICLAGGGATSHVSIIAAAMDIPTLVATGPAVLRIETGASVVLDAEAGWLYVDPSQEEIDLAARQLASRKTRRAAERMASQAECRTADGVRVEVFANVGSETEARAAVENGAEGCGLLRTEFLFLDRTSPPDGAEQLDQYQAIAGALKGRPLTIRTLDIGGDKPIPYLPLPPEENPALGLRGIRTSLWRQDLLRIQLRAILRVRPAGQCRILLPMVTDPAEIRTVRLILNQLQREEGLAGSIDVGTMIETPASAVMADLIAREADFVSIGTNDLTQYTLAMDRGHPELAARVDALHPAVLHLIAKATAGARNYGRVVAICGGLASDPLAVPMLLGLGVHELSMVPGVIPQMKARIALLDTEECRALATRALEQETADAVRALLTGFAAAQCTTNPSATAPSATNLSGTNLSGTNPSASNS